MKNFFFILFAFVLLKVPFAFSQSMDKGDYVSGTINNLYNQKIAITLPDGEWEVIDSYQEDGYQNIELYSNMYDSWGYIYTPIQVTLGAFWSGGGLDKCRGKNVFLSMVDRGNVESSLCFKDEVIDGDEWSVATMDVRTNDSPLKWVSLAFYIPTDRIKSSISENQFKKIGKKVLKALKRAIVGGNSTDMALISEFVRADYTESYAEINDNHEYTNLTTTNTDTLLTNYGNDTTLNVNLFRDFCVALDLECDESFEKDYKDYIYAGRYKAWAVTSKGNNFNNPAWGYSTDNQSIVEAKRNAIEICEEYKYANEVCTIVVEGTQVVNNTLSNDLFGNQNNKTIYANLDSKTICQRATTLDGMNWESLNSEFGGFVNEAFSRNYDLRYCRKLTGRLYSNQDSQETITVDLNTDNTAPIIIIDSSIDVNNARYTIVGEVQDSNKVYICVFDSCKLANNGKFEINRFNPEGETINIIAKDEFGNTSSKTVVVNLIAQTDKKQSFASLDPMKIKKEKNKHRVAIIIGIEDYKFSSKANYANRDALFFAEYLEQMGLSRDKIKTLKDTEAGLIDIYSAVEKWLPAHIVPEKTEVFLYFAGHGLAMNNGKDLYLLAHDTDTDMLSRSSIARSELFDLIDRANPKHTFVFLDTCYSGAGRQGEMLMASARGLVVVENEYSAIPDNFTIFSAAQGNQIASGLDQVQHGLFSYFAMKGLEGYADYNNDKKVSTMELAQYVEEEVRQEAVNIGREQVPMIHGDKNIIITNVN